MILSKYVNRMLYTLNIKKAYASDMFQLQWEADKYTHFYKIQSTQPFDKYRYYIAYNKNNAKFLGKILDINRGMIYHDDSFDRFIFHLQADSHWQNNNILFKWFKNQITDLDYVVDNIEMKDLTSNNIVLENFLNALSDHHKIYLKMKFHYNKFIIGKLDSISHE